MSKSGSERGLGSILKGIGNFTNEGKNSVLIGFLFLIIWKIPPYPAFAAELFVPLKLLSLLAGVTVSWIKVVYNKGNKRASKSIVMSRPISFVTVFLIITALYLIIYPQFKSNTGDLTIVAMYFIVPWFVVINVLFSMMLAMPIIYFRHDLVKLFGKGRDAEDGSDGDKEGDGNNNNSDESLA